jgi:hypothetical protein
MSRLHVSGAREWVWSHDCTAAANGSRDGHDDAPAVAPRVDVAMRLDDPLYGYDDRRGHDRARVDADSTPAATFLGQADPSRHG